jgi:acyl carrier protein
VIKEAKNLLSSVLAIESDAIQDEATSENLSGWDSLAIMQLMVSLEELYGIRVSIRDVESLKSVSGIAELIQKSK